MDIVWKNPPLSGEFLTEEEFNLYHVGEPFKDYLVRKDAEINPDGDYVTSMEFTPYVPEPLKEEESKEAEVGTVDSSENYHPTSHVATQLDSNTSDEGGVSTYQVQDGIKLESSEVTALSRPEILMAVDSTAECSDVSNRAADVCRLEEAELSPHIHATNDALSEVVVEEGTMKNNALMSKEEKISTSTAWDNSANINESNVESYISAKTLRPQGVFPQDGNPRHKLPLKGEASMVPYPYLSRFDKWEQKRFMTLKYQQNYPEFAQHEKDVRENAVKRGDVVLDDTQKAAKDQADLKELEGKVHDEQENFLTHLAWAAKSAPQDYVYMHPDARLYVQEVLNHERARVLHYARRYVQLDSVSLLLPRGVAPPALTHTATLLEMGSVPRCVMPGETAVRRRLLLDAGKLKAVFPPTPVKKEGVWDKPACSRDANVAPLAAQHGARVVMSDRTLLTLLSNHAPDLAAAWEIPVVIRDETSNEEGKETTQRIVYIDAPFPSRTLSTREKNVIFHKVALKSFLLHYNNMMVIGQDCAGPFTAAGQGVRNKDCNVFGFGEDETMFDTFGTTASSAKERKFSFLPSAATASTMPSQAPTTASISDLLKAPVAAPVIKPKTRSSLMSKLDSICQSLGGHKGKEEGTTAHPVRSGIESASRVTLMASPVPAFVEERESDSEDDDDLLRIDLGNASTSQTSGGGEVASSQDSCASEAGDSAEPMEQDQVEKGSSTCSAEPSYSEASESETVSVPHDLGGEAVAESGVGKKRGAGDADSEIPAKRVDEEGESRPTSPGTDEPLIHDIQPLRVCNGSPPNRSYTNETPLAVTPRGSAASSVKRENPLDAILSAQTQLYKLGTPPAGAAPNSGRTGERASPGKRAPQAWSQMHHSVESYKAVEAGEGFCEPTDRYNVSYHMWQLGDIPLLLRYGCDGHDVKGKGKKKKRWDVTVQPKLEYQPNCGYEVMTAGELCEAWLATYLSPRQYLVQARINVFNSEVLQFEQVSKANVAEQIAKQYAPQFKAHNRDKFSPDASLTALHAIVSTLLRLPVGSYLVSHTEGNSHCHIKKSVETTAGVYDLHKAHLSGEDNFEPSPPPWLPVDPARSMNWHIKYGRIPCTFMPPDPEKEKYQLKHGKDSAQYTPRDKRNVKYKDLHPCFKSEFYKKEKNKRKRQKEFNKKKDKRNNAATGQQE